MVSSIPREVGGLGSWVALYVAGAEKEDVESLLAREGADEVGEVELGAGGVGLGITGRMDWGGRACTGGG